MRSKKEDEVVSFNHAMEEAKKINYQDLEINEECFRCNPSNRHDWLKVIAGGITGAFIFWLFWVITLSL